MGNKAVERGLALGIPGVCAEPVQYAELGHRPDCKLLLRSQIQIDGYSLSRTVSSPPVQVRRFAR